MNLQNAPDNGGQNVRDEKTFNDLPQTVLDKICDKLSNHELVKMYDVSTALRASTVQTVRLRRIIVSMGPFDHSNTLHYIPHFSPASKGTFNLFNWTAKQNYWTTIGHVL